MVAHTQTAMQDRADLYLFFVLVVSHLAGTCQQLYVRLLLRKHQWLRSAKLVYKDIATDLSPIIAELCKARFLVNGRLDGRQRFLLFVYLTKNRVTWQS